MGQELGEDGREGRWYQDVSGHLCFLWAEGLITHVKTTSERQWIGRSTLQARRFELLPSNHALAALRWELMMLRKSLV